jgi:hypothetical protein
VEFIVGHNVGRAKQRLAAAMPPAQTAAVATDSAPQ